jgi:urease
MKLGQNILGRRHVHPSVVGTLKQMQVEGTLETGTHLITIHDPISTVNGNFRMALYGSFLPVPDKDPFPEVDQAEFDPLSMPGAVRPKTDDSIVLYKDRLMIEITVVNKGTRAIHVSSLKTPFPPMRPDN